MFTDTTILYLGDQSTGPRYQVLLHRGPGDQTCPPCQFSRQQQDADARQALEEIKAALKTCCAVSSALLGTAVQQHFGTPLHRFNVHQVLWTAAGAHADELRRYTHRPRQTSERDPLEGYQALHTSGHITGPAAGNMLPIEYTWDAPLDLKWAVSSLSSLLSKTYQVPISLITSHVRRLLEEAQKVTAKRSPLNVPKVEALLGLAPNMPGGRAAIGIDTSNHFRCGTRA
jgi:hypothetical protein